MKILLSALQEDFLLFLNLFFKVGKILFRRLQKYLKIYNKVFQIFLKIFHFFITDNFNYSSSSGCFFKNYFKVFISYAITCLSFVPLST